MSMESLVDLIIFMTGALVTQAVHIGTTKATLESLKDDLKEFKSGVEEELKAFNKHIVECTIIERRNDRKAIFKSNEHRGE